MPVFVGGACCWLCGGVGWITTGEADRRITCGMCAGSGVAHEAPSSVAEMVTAIAAIDGVERRTLTVAEVEAAVAEFGPIIEAALHQIEMDEAAQAGRPSTPIS